MMQSIGIRSHELVASRVSSTDQIVLRSRVKDMLEAIARYGCSEGHLGSFTCYGRVYVQDGPSRRRDHVQ